MSFLPLTSTGEQLSRSALPLLLCTAQRCGHIRGFSDLFYPTESTGNTLSDTKMVVCDLFKLFVVPCVCSQQEWPFPGGCRGLGALTMHFSSTSWWFNLALLMGMVVHPRTQGDVEAAVLGK